MGLGTFFANACAFASANVLASAAAFAAFSAFVARARRASSSHFGAEHTASNKCASRRVVSARAAAASASATVSNGKGAIVWASGNYYKGDLFRGAAKAHLQAEKSAKALEAMGVKDAGSMKLELAKLDAEEAENEPTDGVLRPAELSERKLGKASPISVAIA